MLRRPPRSTQSRSSAASEVYKRQDQIGLIVTHVDDQGFLSVAPIGGVAPLLVPGRRFVVHGRGGAVPAVGGRKPSHIIPVEERRTAPDWPEQFLDIGAAGREAALERVAVGDPVPFAPDFVELAPGIVAAQALDCLLYTSPSPRDRTRSRMPSSA